MKSILGAIANDDDFEIIELIKQGADPNTRDDNGTPALHIAAGSDRWMCTAALLSNGADPNALDSQGRSALFAAATLDKETIASQLRDHGADISLRDDKGLDPLKTAVIADNPRLVWWLTCYGADPADADNNGWDAVMHAASAGSLASLEKLLERKDIAVRTAAPDGRDALFLAVEHDHPAIARILRRAGARIDSTGPDGWTPLHAAASRSAGMTEWLLSEGALLNCRDTLGREPLSIAAENGMADSALAMLKHGAEIEAVDEKGNSALHYAARSGHLKTARLLCIAGAARDLSNADGKTPADLASASGHNGLAGELSSDMRSVWLADPNPDTRWQIAAWIGQVGTPLDASHLEALLKALQTAQETRRRQEEEVGDLDLVEKAYPVNPVRTVEGALSRLEDPDAVAELIRRIDGQPAQAHALTKALVSIGGTAMDALLELLRVDPPRLANAASVGVARGGSAEQLKALFDAVGPEVACGAISQAAGYGDIPGARGVSMEMLKPALTNGNGIHRSNAYIALGALKLKGALETLISGLDDPDGVVRQSACAGLQHLGDPAAAPAIVEAYDRLAGRGRMTLLALGEPAMKAVEAGLGKPSPGTRSHLLRLLAEVRGNAAVPLFRKGLEDSDAGVRRTALALLTPHCDDSDIPKLAGLLNGDLWREAAGALGRLGSSDARGALESAASAIASQKSRTREEKERQEFFELLV